MSKKLFVTGTGTDVGKTYVTALMVKKLDRKSTRLNSSHVRKSRMPSSA